jgi:hypothetical protein
VLQRLFLRDLRLDRSARLQQALHSELGLRDELLCEGQRHSGFRLLVRKTLVRAVARQRTCRAGFSASPSLFSLPVALPDAVVTNNPSTEKASSAPAATRARLPAPQLARRAARS